MLITQNHPLQDLHTFHFSVYADFFIKITQAEDFALLFAHPWYQEKSILWLGGGSNLVFTSEKIDRLVVQIATRGIKCLKETDTEVLIEAAAGENWHAFVQTTLQNGWFGLENLSLIPGTVGAAPVQNIGAYGVELKDTVFEIDYWNLNFTPPKLETLNCAAAKFGYRDSLFKKALRDKAAITAVRFTLKKQADVKVAYGDILAELAKQQAPEPYTPQSVSNAVIAQRLSKLPNPDELGNAGSFFKNPVIDAAAAQVFLSQYPNAPHYSQANGYVKLAAGWLIEQAGFKGHRAGQVGVHTKQALVLVNYGGGTGQAITELATTIQTAIEQQFGIILEAEPNFI
ncbi:MAG: UDP-N-acetylmuramate dehydrogenase [Neisseriaceae bacterium]|nr:UDP-N-acetylmuramate dehydrogenase [Neisseriaceae bacterium]